MPRGNLVCYLDNAFGPPIISKLPSGWKHTTALMDAATLVVHVVARHRDAFERSSIFRILDETRDAVIFTTVPG
jgi:hypothetical protein